MELEVRAVVPFYLDMMGTNVLAYPVPFDALREVGRALTDEDVVALLRGQWRPRVMGGWFAVGRDAPVVHDALLRSLETASGTLTAPVLATVAVRALGSGAVPALRSYLAADRANGYGAAGFVATALEHLGESQDVELIGAVDRSAFHGMLEVAGQLGVCFGESGG